jgi:hypothetical protein
MRERDFGYCLVKKTRTCGRDRCVNVKEVPKTSCLKGKRSLPVYCPECGRTMRKQPKKDRGGHVHTVHECQNSRCSIMFLQGDRIVCASVIG